MLLLLTLAQELKIPNLLERHFNEVNYFSISGTIVVTNIVYFIKTRIFIYSFLEALLMSKRIRFRKSLVGSICLENLYQLLTR